MFPHMLGLCKSPFIQIPFLSEKKKKAFHQPVRATLKIEERHKIEHYTCIHTYKYIYIIYILFFFFQIFTVQLMQSGSSSFICLLVLVNAILIQQQMQLNLHLKQKTNYEYIRLLNKYVNSIQ